MYVCTTKHIPTYIRSIRKQKTKKQKNKTKKQKNKTKQNKTFK